MTRAGASSELGKKGVISQLVALFWRFNGDDKKQPREITLQQQVLWALGALAAEEVNVERMKNAELFRVLWLILGPQEGPSKKELEQLQHAYDEHGRHTQLLIDEEKAASAAECLRMQRELDALNGLHAKALEAGTLGEG